MRRTEQTLPQRSTEQNQHNPDWWSRYCRLANAPGTCQHRDNEAHGVHGCVNRHALRQPVHVASGPSTGTGDNDFDAAAKPAQGRSRNFRPPLRLHHHSACALACHSPLTCHSATKAFRSPQHAQVSKLPKLFRKQWGLSHPTLPQTRHLPIRPVQIEEVRFGLWTVVPQNLMVRLHPIQSVGLSGQCQWWPSYSQGGQPGPNAT